MGFVAGAGSIALGFRDSTLVLSKLISSSRFCLLLLSFMACTVLLTAASSLCA